MGQMSQDEINVDLFDDVKRLKKENSELSIRVRELSDYAEKLEGECDNYGVDRDHILIGEDCES